MPASATQTLAAVLFVLGCHPPLASAQPPAGVAERSHAAAVASFRDARFPEAYARFIRLADAGHAASAEVALWMYHHGPTLFGSDWDITPDQLTAWARLANPPSPVLAEREPLRAPRPAAGRAP